MSRSDGVGEARGVGVRRPVTLRDRAGLLSLPFCNTMTGVDGRLRPLLATAGEGVTGSDNFGGGVEVETADEGEAEAIFIFGCC